MCVCLGVICMLCYRRQPTRGLRGGATVEFEGAGDGRAAARLAADWCARTRHNALHATAGATQLQRARNLIARRPPQTDAVCG